MYSGTRVSELHRTKTHPHICLCSDFSLLIVSPSSRPCRNSVSPFITMARLPLLLVAVQLMHAQARPSIDQGPDGASVPSASNDTDDTPSTEHVIGYDNSTDTEMPDWMDDYPGYMNESAISTLLKRAEDLSGRATPSGLGVYPEGYTSYGGRVWECPAECQDPRLCLL